MSTTGSRTRLVFGFGLLASGLLAAGCGEEFVLADHQVAAPSSPNALNAPTSPPSAPEPCIQNEPLRSAFFGDLHVHTSLSSDARMYSVGVDPDGAYRYAFGQRVRLPPNDENGLGTRVVRIDRPLDFAAVTDHAEFLGEGVLCYDSDSEVYDGETCREIRDGKTPTDSSLGMFIMLPAPWRRDDVCGEDNARCNRAAEGAWQDTIRAAESWNDTTAGCARTTFVAYEYSSFRLGSNLHRNVIFRNATVPKRPISYIEVQREWQLWQLLKETCNESGTGCDALAIPHNSNISNGRMFAVDYPGAYDTKEEAARARLRIEMEPIVEIMQHKGDSECRPGAPGVLGGPDELCGFEKFENMAFSRNSGEAGTCYAGPLADAVPHLGPNCVSRLSYTRYALIEGLAEEERLGTNPYKFGLMASTDTHNGLAGGVEERSFPGHLGTADATLAQRVELEPGTYGNTANGPGGLIGIWAQENSRESLFEAMRRKEVFGTSGPRIRPRFFGGWGYGPELCSDPDALAAAYAGGVPMGGDLPARPTRAAGSEAPTFFASAYRDAGTAEAPGGLLQRIQVVKGWIDDQGAPHEQVIDIAGAPGNGARVDPATCAPQGPGYDTLCSVWRDPDFDPSRRAVYYARVVENPSCRYSAWQCLAVAAAERPAECDSPKLVRTIQERAWTSPIWYTPPD